MPDRQKLYFAIGCSDILIHQGNSSLITVIFIFNGSFLMLVSTIENEEIIENDAADIL